MRIDEKIEQYLNEAKILKGSFTVDPMSGEDRAKILDLAKRKNINIISKHDKNGYVVVDLDRDSLKASMFLSALVTDSSAKFKEINEASTPVDRIKSAARELKKDLDSEYKSKEERLKFLSNINSVKNHLESLGIMRTSKIKDVAYIEKIIKATKEMLSEASAPSKDEIAYVVGNAPGEPNKFIVYGSKEHAEKSMTKYALKPKKSLAQALFAANDEQGYTHYTVKRGYDAWEPVKRIPAKYLDADKYMVD